jgi:hypothetical protein
LRRLTVSSSIALGEMLIAERDNLALDSRAQWAQQKPELDVDPKVFLRHGDRARGTGSLEVENVPFPSEGPAVVFLQPPCDRLRKTSGLRQSKVMLSANDNGRHLALCSPSKRTTTTTLVTMTMR